MSTQQVVEGLDETFRQAQKVYRGYLAAALALVAVCVIFQVTGVMEQAVWEDPLGPILGVALGVVGVLGAVYMSVVARINARRQPATPAVLLTGLILRLAGMEAIAVYGVIIGMLWRPDVGIAFAVVGGLGVLVSGPRRRDWENYLRRA